MLRAVQHRAVRPERCRRAVLARRQPLQRRAQRIANDEAEHAAHGAPLVRRETACDAPRDKVRASLQRGPLVVDQLSATLVAAEALEERAAG